MVFLTYNVSERLQKSLAVVEKARRKILLAPLPREVEIRLKWEAKVKRVYLGIFLSGVEVSEGVVVNLLKKHTKVKLTPQEREILSLKEAYDWIDMDWSVTAKVVNLETIFELRRMIVGGKKMSETKEMAVLKETLEYAQKAMENPVIGAGVVSMKLLELEKFFGEYTDRVARALIYLFLSKYGYDFRKMLAFEKYWFENKDKYERALGLALREKNVTPWLEFLSLSIAESLKGVAASVSEPKFEIDMPEKYWKINKRQKEILLMLEVPTMKVTNRDVQKKFKVSQITASRDLSSLSDLGMVFTHGSGRSVYYTKA